MPSIGTLGGTLPLGPKSLKVKRQAFPHDDSTGRKQPTPPARLSQITITGLEPRMQASLGTGKAMPHVSMKPLESTSPARGLELGLQKCGRMHLRCFKPLVCDVLLERPQEKRERLPDHLEVNQGIQPTAGAKLPRPVAPSVLQPGP